MASLLLAALCLVVSIPLAKGDPPNCDAESSGGCSQIIAGTPDGRLFSTTFPEEGFVLAQTDIEANGDVRARGRVFGLALLETDGDVEALGTITGQKVVAVSKGNTPPAEIADVAEGGLSSAATRERALTLNKGI
ncbi:unnamed protein product [Vitrella brassicaformis CCMP3155]|uniref:Uncharacterized protein n=2 Tax=Vitrella brassicaformis TaxID=1169539 RepID=A0A0G4FPL0_VITBC|nr:unnamed protein product [Vitrella brassicaformis CCMP3155]|mmetsp:Transcript_52621/g.132233  ORF Transcript_52621/g.132233 Transcript_52621/m.132233 type:complete len:135 (+) Transcript_52621:1-405(+)|eukprot:CEM16398.1 unnamed protein product [Vitrella brassicaformis CCMP3155]